MSSAAGYRHPKCHILNYFYDKDDGCALTVLVNDVRFHIIADASQLKGSTGPEGKLARQYRQLLAQVKAAEDDFTKPCSQQNLRSFDENQSFNSQDSGHGTADGSDESDDDSAIDVNEAQADPEKALNDWMLSPFGPVFEEKASTRGDNGEKTVEEWYSGTTYFYTLSIKDGCLTAGEDEATEDLERRMVDIVPRMHLPKKIREMDIPWYPAKDVIVLDASDNPSPYHPTRVRVGNSTYFLKMIDPTQPQPTKRELSVMKRIEKEGLHKEMRVPLVEGLVGFEDSKTQIMGFLQTEIEDPTPLTQMLDDDVPQEKREKWAKESERMKKLLHDHKVIWGDAKADNFMVDKHDKLWIIDFGGSYTDGWVDPELMETKEGDDMGVDRIVNALQDPNANTWDPEDEKIPSKADSSSSPPKKRKAEELDAENSEEKENDDVDKKQPLPKKRARGDAESKTQTSDDEGTNSATGKNAEDADANSGDSEEQEQHCLCNEPDSGEMVGCDGADCPRRWFHFECVGLEEAPKSKKWYCDECKNN